MAGRARRFAEPRHPASRQGCGRPERRCAYRGIVDAARPRRSTTITGHPTRSTHRPAIGPRVGSAIVSVDAAPRTSIAAPRAWLASTNAWLVDAERAGADTDTRLTSGGAAVFRLAATSSCWARRIAVVAARPRRGRSPGDPPDASGPDDAQCTTLSGARISAARRAAHRSAAALSGVPSNPTATNPLRKSAMALSCHRLPSRSTVGGLAARTQSLRSPQRRS